jgi:integrase
MVNFRPSRNANALNCVVQGGKTLKASMRQKKNPKTGKVEGIWYESFYYKGKMYGRSLGTTDEDQAFLNLCANVTKIMEGGPTSTFNEATEKYVKEDLEFNKSSTKERTNSLLDLHLKPFFGKTSVSDISSKIKEYVYKRANGPAQASYTTVHKEIIYLAAVVRKVLPSFKTPKIDKRMFPKESLPTEDDLYMTDADFENILPYSIGWERLFLLLGRYTGAAPVDLLDMHFSGSSIDLDARCIKLIRNKTNSHEIDMDIHPNLYQVLAEYKLRNGNKPIFNYSRAAFKTATNRLMKRLCIESRVEHKPPKVLRNKYCTDRLAAGDNPKDVQRDMGHASISTTLKYWKYVEKEKTRKARIGHNTLTPNQGLRAYV